MPYKNKEDERRNSKRYQENNREKIKEQKHQSYILHSEEVKERVKKWQDNNPKKVKSYKMKWKENNPNYHKEYNKVRNRIDLKFNLNSRMSCLIRQSLKGNKAGRHWETLVDYDLNDLIKHLKKTIPIGYNWQDYLNGDLHIDHYTPKSAFNFTKAEHTDFQRCWALSNLRLLPAKENLIKANRLIGPFQPCLKISIVEV